MAMNLIENKIDEIKENLLELVKLYNEANTKLSENKAPSTIVRMTIVDKEKIEQMLYNTFGENLVYTDEYPIKKRAKLINSYLPHPFDIDKAEVKFNKELEGKLFNSFTFEYHEECGGCWLVTEETKIALNSFYGEDDDDPEKFGFLISFCDDDYNEIDMGKRHWVDCPEPKSFKEFEVYKLFYLELLEKYSSKDLVY